MAVVLRLVPSPSNVESPSERPTDVEERAWAMVQDLRTGGGFERGTDLADPDVLRQTLLMVGELDLDLLVSVAAEAIEAVPAKAVAG